MKKPRIDYEAMEVFHCWANEPEKMYSTKQFKPLFNDAWKEKHGKESGHANQVKTVLVSARTA